MCFKQVWIELYIEYVLCNLHMHHVVYIWLSFPVTVDSIVLCVWCVIIDTQVWSVYYGGGLEVVYHVIDMIISLSLGMVYCVVQCATRLACELCKFEYYMCTKYSWRGCIISNIFSCLYSSNALCNRWLSCT